ERMPSAGVAKRASGSAPADLAGAAVEADDAAGGAATAASAASPTAASRPLRSAVPAQPASASASAIDTTTITPGYFITTPQPPTIAPRSGSRSSPATGRTTRASSSPRYSSTRVGHSLTLNERPSG